MWFSGRSPARGRLRCGAAADNAVPSAQQRVSFRRNPPWDLGSSCPTASPGTAPSGTSSAAQQPKFRSVDPPTAARRGCRGLDLLLRCAVPMFTSPHPRSARPLQLPRWPRHLGTGRWSAQSRPEELRGTTWLFHHVQGTQCPSKPLP